MKNWSLRASDVRSADRWYWRLFDDNGQWVADHEVNLDRNTQEWIGFGSLDSYLFAAKTPEAQRERLIRMGDWIGNHVLGDIGEKLAGNAPLTVRIEIDSGSEDSRVPGSWIFSRPFEITRVGGQFLAKRRVSFVFTEGAHPGRRKEIHETLRVLAVFSNPSTTSPLGIRRERYQLYRLLSVYQAQGFAVDFKVLQLGTTRRELEDIVGRGGGWDVVHIAAHGRAGELALETDEGNDDRLGAHEISELLMLTRHRLKWLLLFACGSAALPAKRVAPEVEVLSIAPALARDLDCAVLGMRFAVGEDFAQRLIEELYPRVLGDFNSGDGQRLPLALASSLSCILDTSPSSSFRPLSYATPALFGHRALDLKFSLPREARTERTWDSGGYAFLKKMRPCFVGRHAILKRASRILSAGSPCRAAIFHGAPGLGKTACLLELAWQYSDLPRFTRVLHFEAPSDATESLEAFAAAWERIDGAPPLREILERGELEARLPELSYFLRRRAILLVLDRLDLLLREPSAPQEPAEWRDPRWRQLWDALLDLDPGASRLLAASRWLPRASAGPDGEARSLEPIDLTPLDANEARILAKELEVPAALLDRLSGEVKEPLATGLRLAGGHPDKIEQLVARLKGGGETPAP